MHASVHISSYPSMYACVCPPVYPSMHSSIHPCVHPSIQKYLSIFCSAPDTIVGESESHSVVSDSLQSHALYSPWNSLGQNTGVSSFSPFPPPGDLANPGIKPRSPALQADSLPAEPPGKPSGNVVPDKQERRWQSNTGR